MIPGSSLPGDWSIPSPSLGHRKAAFSPAGGGGHTTNRTQPCKAANVENLTAGSRQAGRLAWEWCLVDYYRHSLAALRALYHNTSILLAGAVCIHMVQYIPRPIPRVGSLRSTAYTLHLARSSHPQSVSVRPLAADCIPRVGILSTPRADEPNKPGTWSSHAKPTQYVVPKCLHTHTRTLSPSLCLLTLGR